jgi:polysaccharide biosynthesis/export protein
MIKPLIAGVLLVCAATCSLAAQQEAAPAKELIQYVQDARKAGVKDSDIQRNAEGTGWPAAMVKDAIAQGQPSTPKVAEAAAEPTPSPARPEGEVAAKAAATPAVTPAVSPAVSPAAGPATIPPTTPAGTAAPGTAAPEATAPGGKAAGVSRGVPDQYQIGGGDVISINVWGEPSATVGSLVVRPDGKISMPLVKEVSVAGLTPTQLEKVITEQLADKIKAADVTVVVNQVNSKKVFLVGGGVKREGPLAFSYSMTVMQALSEAGGLSDYAKRKKIYVLRNEAGRQFKLPFDYDAVLNGERMELNIPLVPGDIIVVPNH